MTLKKCNPIMRLTRKILVHEIMLFEVLTTEDLDGDKTWLVHLENANVELHSFTVLC